MTSEEKDKKIIELEHKVERLTSINQILVGAVEEYEELKTKLGIQ